MYKVTYRRRYLGDNEYIRNGWEVVTKRFDDPVWARGDVDQFIDYLDSANGKTSEDGVPVPFEYDMDNILIEEV